MSGRVVAVVGPSGAGKDTLIRAALDHCPEARMIRRTITRPADAGGEDFDGVTCEEFAAMRSAGRFALDWQAHGLCYGVPRPEGRASPWLVNLSRGVLSEAALVFRDLSVIHVAARPEIRVRRLAARGRESAAEIAARIGREPVFRPGALSVRHVDNSGDLEDAVAAFIAAMKERPIP